MDSVLTVPGAPLSPFKIFRSHQYKVEVHCTEEAFALLARGQGLRSMAVTEENAASSRSHSIFTIRIARVELGIPHSLSVVILEPLTGTPTQVWVEW